MADSLDRIFKAKYDKKLVVPFLESKLFGIGLESYTVNSHEFVMGYAMKRGILALLDMGHFHLSESVADKISSFLMFFGKVAFHISRPVRWDSDHVIRQNDDLRACAQEIVRMGPENFIVALDYFDASINRVAAWVLGMRNMQKELLRALLTPNATLKEMQDAGRFTELLVLQEEYKNYPMEEVWAEFCKRAGVPAGEEWLKAVQTYEKKVLALRTR
jgi:L-rhamnose isomerase